MNDYINYYDLLGIKKDANNEEIKKAYRELAKKWHPDLNKDPKAPEMARKINEAKEILLDETKRKEYDIYLDNYKNGAYNNLNKKQNNTYNTNNNYEEKTYTKWEYFRLYLKYYKINTFRKIIGTILVLLESLLCTILQAINYIIAFILAYFNYYLTYGFAIVGGLLIIVMILGAVFNIGNFSFTSYTLMAIGAILSMLLCYLMPNLPNIFINKIPIQISKLNMFLFKKSMGYKK